MFRKIRDFFRGPMGPQGQDGYTPIVMTTYQDKVIVADNVERKIYSLHMGHDGQWVWQTISHF